MSDISWEWEQQTTDISFSIPEPGGDGGVTQGDIDNSIGAHAEADDPHGDRAWANEAFAALAHDHDEDYAPLAHTHDFSEQFAPLAHTHEALYAKYGSVGLNVLSGAPSASSGWLTGTTLNIPWYGVTAQNSWAEWDNVPLGGIYKLNAGGIQNTTYGIITVEIDDVVVGSFDTYGPSAAAAIWAIPEITIAPGLHNVRISNPTKFGTSGGYVIRLSSMAFNRIA